MPASPMTTKQAWRQLAAESIAPPVRAGGTAAVLRGVSPGHAA